MPISGKRWLCLLDKHRYTHTHTYIQGIASIAIFAESPIFKHLIIHIWSVDLLREICINNAYESDVFEISSAPPCSRWETMGHFISRRSIYSQLHLRVPTRDERAVSRSTVRHGMHRPRCTRLRARARDALCATRARERASSKLHEGSFLIDTDVHDGGGGGGNPIGGAVHALILRDQPLSRQI